MFEILLIEDSPEFALLTTHWLEENNFAKVTHAADGATALGLLSSGQWDLVVSDIELPGVSGLDLIKAAKASAPWTSVLIITAVQSVSYAQQAVQNHADGLLFKPFEKQAFLLQVRELAEQTRQKRHRERRSVLAIGAHPDDVEIGCGGALAMHHANGDAVTILTLSHGAAGGDALIRAEEAHGAARQLGASLHLGDMVDTSIPEGAPTISAIQAVINMVQPTHIYTHSPFDTHQDHRNVHHASMVAARGVGNVFCYQAPSGTVDFRPTLFVDISGFIEHKLRAIGSYESQTSVRAYLAEDLIVATARFWGRYAGYVLAEPLEVVRQRSD